MEAILNILTFGVYGVFQMRKQMDELQKEQRKLIEEQRKLIDKQQQLLKGLGRL
jgi:hypothetical protein